MSNLAFAQAVNQRIALLHTMPYFTALDTLRSAEN
jgi:hypothetical protein